MSKYSMFLLAAAFTGVISYMMFADSDPSTRITTSVILAVGIGVTVVLIFGRKKSNRDSISQ